MGEEGVLTSADKKTGTKVADSDEFFKSPAVVPEEVLAEETAEAVNEAGRTFIEGEGEKDVDGDVDMFDTESSMLTSLPAEMVEEADETVAEEIEEEKVDKGKKRWVNPDPAYVYLRMEHVGNVKVEADFGSEDADVQITGAQSPKTEAVSDSDDALPVKARKVKKFPLVPRSGPYMDIKDFVVDDNPSPKKRSRELVVAHSLDSAWVPTRVSGKSFTVEVGENFKFNLENDYHYIVTALGVAYNEKVEKHRNGKMKDTTAKKVSENFRGALSRLQNGNISEAPMACEHCQRYRLRCFVSSDSVNCICCHARGVKCSNNRAKLKEADESNDRKNQAYSDHIECISHAASLASTLVTTVRNAPASTLEKLTRELLNYIGINLRQSAETFADHCGIGQVRGGVAEAARDIRANNRAALLEANSQRRMQLGIGFAFADSVISAAPPVQSSAMSSGKGGGKQKGYTRKSTSKADKGKAKTPSPAPTPTRAQIVEFDSSDEEDECDVDFGSDRDSGPEHAGPSGRR